MRARIMETLKRYYASVQELELLRTRALAIVPTIAQSDAEVKVLIAAIEERCQEERVLLSKTIFLLEVSILGLTDAEKRSAEVVPDDELAQKVKMSIFRLYTERASIYEQRQRILRNCSASIAEIGAVMSKTLDDTMRKLYGFHLGAVNSTIRVLIHEILLLDENGADDLYLEWQNQPAPIVIRPVGILSDESVGMPEVKT